MSKCEAPFVSKLVLTNFRNYARISQTFDNRPVVLFGPNGAGKTNVLEAISFLSPGRGLRRTAFAKVAASSGDGCWAMAADLSQDDHTTRIGTGTQMGPMGVEKSRRININKVPASSNDVLLEYSRILWLTPSMDRLFSGPAGDRRRFLDRLVLANDPAHGKRVLAYEKAIAGRNKLLDGTAPNEVWLDGLEQQIAELGTSIAFARRELVSNLKVAMNEPDLENSDFPTANLELIGPFEALFQSNLPAIDLELKYAEQLKAGRPRDAAASRTLFGPHRSDLDVFHREKVMPAGQASTGEQKALLIGIIFAHAKLIARLDGRAPLLLLDEITTHLDAARRASLFDAVCALNAQVWMTGTDLEFFKALGEKAQYLSVDNGALTPSD